MGALLVAGVAASQALLVQVGVEDRLKHVPVLDLQRAEHMARMRELTRLKQDGDLRTVLLADHALFHIEADLRWMETTAARLSELREEVRS